MTEAPVFIHAVSVNDSTELSVAVPKVEPNHTLPQQVVRLASTGMDAKFGSGEAQAPSLERKRKRTTNVPVERLLDDIDGVEGRHVSAVQLLDEDARAVFAQELAGAYTVLPGQRLHDYFEMLIVCRDSRELSEAMQGKQGLTQAIKKLRHIISGSPKEVARIIEQAPYFTADIMDCAQENYRLKLQRLEQADREWERKHRRAGSAGLNGSDLRSPGSSGGAQVSSSYRPKTDVTWRDQAACRPGTSGISVDPDAFFPEKGGSTRRAKEICGTCAVRAACLNYAQEANEHFGVWGGLSERERRQLKRVAG